MSRYDPEESSPVTSRGMHVGDITMLPGTKKVDFIVTEEHRKMADRYLREAGINNGTLPTPLFSPAERALHWTVGVIVVGGALFPIVVLLCIQLGVIP